LIVAQERSFIAAKMLPELMEDKPQVALRVGLIGVWPQQGLEDIPPMFLARGIGKKSKELGSLLARQLNGPLVGVPQAEPSEQCDL
jgi:hypothetical protein